jgi:hypothetical protein
MVFVKKKLVIVAARKLMQDIAVICVCLEDLENTVIQNALTDA